MVNYGDPNVDVNTYNRTERNRWPFITVSAYSRIDEEDLEGRSIIWTQTGTDLASSLEGRRMCPSIYP